MNLKKISQKEELFTGGHRLCSGCGPAIVARQVLMAVDDPVVVANATGCLEVGTTIFPYSSWKTPWVHNAFENAAATISGIEKTYKSFKKRGKIKKNIKFIAFGGDGGTYDIGLQSLSGACERGHDFLYICYNNEAYMNTGIQRSSATPKGGATTTSPVGDIIPGKKEFSKDLTEIMAAHDIPYVGQTALGFHDDLINKVKKALKYEGPKFINILAPCRLGWRYDGSLTPKIGRLAVDTCFWPLYEVEKGKHKLNYKPTKKKPVIKWLESQGRFSHLLESKNKKLVKEIQEEVNDKWNVLKKKCGE